MGAIECRDAHLGLASTRDLLLEIQCRGEMAKIDSMEMSATRLLELLPKNTLDYRTVDS